MRQALASTPATHPSNTHLAGREHITFDILRPTSCNLPCKLAPCAFHGSPSRHSPLRAQLAPPPPRSVSLGLFHALGRLLYCKRIPPGGGERSAARRFMTCPGLFLGTAVKKKLDSFRVVIYLDPPLGGKKCRTSIRQNFPPDSEKNAGDLKKHPDPRF